MLLNGFLNWSLKMLVVVLLSNIYPAGGNRHICGNVELAKKGKKCEETARLHLD